MDLRIFSGISFIVVSLLLQTGSLAGMNRLFIHSC